MIRVDAILAGRAIDVYNDGKMERDFTHVSDIVRGIQLLMECIPDGPNDIHDANNTKAALEEDSLSPVAPFRIVNLGNSEKVALMDCIEAIESSLGVKAIRNYMPMQKGDVLETLADGTLLKRLTGYQPQVGYKDGVERFVKWFREYYQR